MIHQPKTFALVDSGFFGYEPIFSEINATTWVLPAPGFSWREEHTIQIYSAQIHATTAAELEVEGSVDGQNWHVIHSYNPGTTVFGSGSPAHAGDWTVITPSALPHMRFRMKNPTADALFIVRVVC